VDQDLSGKGRCPEASLCDADYEGRAGFAGAAVPSRRAQLAAVMRSPRLPIGKFRSLRLRMSADMAAFRSAVKYATEVVGEMAFADDPSSG